MSDALKTDLVQLHDPLLGAMLGEYQVIEPIGEGGMGVVYSGVQPVIKKRVAIKVLKPTAAADSTHVKRLIAEAQAVNSIGHRNIIDIFSLGQLPDGRPYIVMEFLEGEPLDAYLYRQGRLPLDEALWLLIAVCGPLGAAHRANVIHRDLKPSNIFLCRQPDDGARYLKLLDFGLAKKAVGLDGVTAQTSQAVIAGTPDFMAPEQARGMSISPRTDLYAFGVMAYQLITGELPYLGQTAMDVLMKHVSGPIPSASERLAGVPVALDALIQRLMAKAPEDRPQSMDEVREALLAMARTLDPARAWESTGSSWPRAGAVATPHGVAPVAAESNAATVLSQRAPRPGTSGLIVVGAAAAAFLVGGVGVRAVLALRSPPAAHSSQPAPGPVGVEPAAAPAPPSPPVPAPPSGPAGGPAPLADAPLLAVPPRIDPPVAVEPSAPPPIAEVRPPPTRPGRTAVGPRHGDPLTPEGLRKRVARLEAALKKATPAGEEPDPSAVTLLRKYKVGAMMDSTADERLALSKSLDQFEQTFLAR